MTPEPGSDQDRAELLLECFRALLKTNGVSVIRTHYYIMRWLATEPLGTLDLTLQSEFVKVIRTEALPTWQRLRPYLLPTCIAATKGYL